MVRYWFDSLKAVATAPGSGTPNREESGVISAINIAHLRCVYENDVKGFARTDKLKRIGHPAGVNRPSLTAQIDLEWWDWHLNRLNHDDKLKLSYLVDAILIVLQAETENLRSQFAISKTGSSHSSQMTLSTQICSAAKSTANLCVCLTIRNSQRRVSRSQFNSLSAEST